MKPTHTKVLTSTAITKVEWYASGRMTVTFKAGKPYDFGGVPEKDYLALVGAESAGRHFAAHIKGKFDLIAAGV